MLNYNDVARMATAGINFFRGGSGEFKCKTDKGGVQIIGGVEIYEPKEELTIRGFVRSPKMRDIDGESIIATDKLGVFDNSVEIKRGYHVVIDGETYIVTDPRPIRQTNVTVAYRPILRRIAIHG